MAPSAGTSSFKRPWAWLSAVVVFGLVLAASTWLYTVNPTVKLEPPWWMGVAGPALVYALVLPLCVPRLRLGGWLAGFLTLAVLHVGIGLATARLYTSVSVTSYEQALATALWGFPPAVVFTMIGSLVMALPFFGALVPAPRPRALNVPPRVGAGRSPRPASPRVIPTPAVVKGVDRSAWARASAGPVTAAVAAPAVTKFPRGSQVAARLPVLAPEPPAAPVAPPVRIKTAPQEATEARAHRVEGPPVVSSEEIVPTAIPDFRQALSELFGAPDAGTGTREASASPDELVAPEPSWTPAADAPAPPLAVAPDAVVRIPFDRVAGQLPPGAFRVPLGELGAMLQDPEMLVVPQAAIVPQLSEGVVQVAWELVAEQFPAAVLAVAPAAVKERIVNGQLFLPLDEIVRQLPPHVFAASLGRGMVEVPGIESFPAPFKPSGSAGLSSESTVAEPASSAPDRWGVTEAIAAILAPWDTVEPEEVQIGDFAIISVSAGGSLGGAVAAAAGRLSPLLAHRAPQLVEQAVLHGAGGTLVLTPLGSGWRTGTVLAVGVRPGAALAEVEGLARRAAAAHDPASPAPLRHAPSLPVRLEAAPSPPGAPDIAEALAAFGPLTPRSYREPASGARIHCFVSPGTSAADLAPFAGELAQAMAEGAQSTAFGSFHVAVLRSGSARVEIRLLSSGEGPASLLVVGGADTGRPDLARAQVERAAARLRGA